MAELVAKSPCLLSNPTTKRTSSKASKESTGRMLFVCESSQDAREQQPLTSSRNYLKRYKQNFKKAEQEQATRIQLASIVKIQRYWRFHLAMRRRVQEKLIRDFTLQNQSLKRIERNEQIESMLLANRIEQIKNTHKVAVSEILKQSKQQVMDFAKKSAMNSLSKSGHLENLRLELCYHQKQLSTNLQIYQQAIEKIASLRKNKQVLLDKERDLVEKIGSLNKTLLLENIEKSKIQLEYDELKIQNDKLRCKI